MILYFVNAIIEFLLKVGYRYYIQVHVTLRYQSPQNCLALTVLAFMNE